MIKKIIDKITNNAYSYSVITKLISVLTGLLYTVLYSRYLGAELRGTASVINNYVEMIMLVLCFGVYQAYPYYKKKTGEDRYREYINNVFAMFLCYLGIAVVFLLAVRPSTNVCVVALLIPTTLAIKELNYVVLIESPKRVNTMQLCLDVFDILLLVTLMIFALSFCSLLLFFLLMKIPL